jgi:hypothetical protein
VYFSNAERIDVKFFNDFDIFNPSIRSVPACRKYEHQLMPLSRRASDYNKYNLCKMLNTNYYTPERFRCRDVGISGRNHLNECPNSRRIRLLP